MLEPVVIVMTSEGGGGGGGGGGAVVAPPPQPIDAVSGASAVSESKKRTRRFKIASLKTKSVEASAEQKVQAQAQGGLLHPRTDRNGAEFG